MLNNNEIQKLYAEIRNITVKAHMTQWDGLKIEDLTTKLAISHRQANDELKKTLDIIDKILQQIPGRYLHKEYTRKVSL